VIQRLTGGGYEQQVLIDTYGVISVSSLAAPAPAFSMQSAQSPQFSVIEQHWKLVQHIAGYFSGNSRVVNTAISGCQFEVSVYLRT
jgi:hypothetical protein